MDYEEMIGKIYVYKRHNLTYANDVTRHIMDLKSHVDDHYEKVLEAARSWGKKNDSIMDCIVWATAFRNDLAMITRSAIMSFNYILDVIEDFIEHNRSELEEFDMVPVWNYMEYLIELIWDLDSMFSMVVRYYNKNKDFTKSKRFQTICERYLKNDGSEELANFIEINKVSEKIEDFFNQMKFANDYMANVFTDKMSYKIKGDYINIFDAIVNSSELLYEEFYHICVSLTGTVKVYYKHAKEPVLDNFVLFMTNTVFDNLIFSTFDKFAKVLYTVRDVMPKERSIV